MFSQQNMQRIHKNGLALPSPLTVVQEEHKQGNVVGLDVSTGEALDPAMAGIFDNYLVKKQILQSAPVVASQLLLVDEVMRAGETEKAHPHGSLKLREYFADGV